MCVSRLLTLDLPFRKPAWRKWLSISMLDLKSDYIWSCITDLMDLKRLDPINKGIKETEKRRKGGS